jgi:hypothetical protein
MTRDQLQDAVLKGVKYLGGSATLVQVARYIWDNHEHELRASGDRFYTWQYEMRWAATQLRNKGLLQSAELSPKGLWIAI